MTPPEQNENGILTFGHCDPDVKYDDRRVAYAVVLRENTFAAVRSRRGGYFLPGGGAVAGEEAEQTVRREIREELACESRLLRCLGEVNQYFFSASDDKHYRMQVVFFTAELAEHNEVLHGLGEEPLVWLSVEQAHENLFHACHAWAVAVAAKA